MKLLISFMTAVSLGLIGTVLGGDNYSALAAKGYRWVTVNGPYACTTEQDAERIVAHHTDAIELQVVENIECYYLIPGTIVQVIKEDPTRGISEIIGDTLRKHHQVSMYLQPIPQQASG
jgi:hypothetical protein